MSAQITYSTPKTEILTIASGAIAVPASGALIVNATIDTESAAATDDLTAITGGSVGMILIIKSTNAARVPTVKDGGTLFIQADFALDSPYDTLVLQCVAADNWIELSRASNA